MPMPAWRPAGESLTTGTTWTGDGWTEPMSTPSDEPTTAQRLQELETQRATGAISDEEYHSKRQQILSDL